MLNLNKTLLLLVFGSLSAGVANAQESYPKNGLVFSKEFRVGIDTFCVKRNTYDVPKGRTWTFFNDNKNAVEKISFTVGKDGQEGTAICSRILDEIGVSTTAKMSPRGTIVGTFKIGQVKNRETDKIPYYHFLKLFYPKETGKSPKSCIRLFYVDPPYVKMLLDKELKLTKVVKRDSVAQQLYDTYEVDLGIKHDEWTTVAITYDTDKKEVVYYANGKKAEYANAGIISPTSNHYKGRQRTEIHLAETDFGDVAVSDIGVYNRILSKNELLALTANGGADFTEAESLLKEPYVRMNWTFAYIQLALALLFMVFNILTKRWKFVPTLCLFVGGFAVLAVFVRGMLPYLPFTSDWLSGDDHLNLPSTIMGQLGYIAKYDLPGVLVSLVLCISVSFVHEEGFSTTKKVLNLTLPYLIVPVLFFVGQFGAMAFFIALGVLAVGAFIFAFANAPDDVLVDRGTGDVVGTTPGVGSFSGILFVLLAVVAIILIAYFVSSIYIFLFNFFFIYIVIKNYFKGELEDLFDFK